MKKFFLLLFLVPFSLFLASGCGDEKNSADDTKYDGTIIIGFDEFAPMGFTNESGNVVGFDVDLAKETAARMGATLEFKSIEWNSKEAELRGGRIDVIWNGLDITPELQDQMIFSKPYMDNRQILLVAAGNPKNIHGVKDLAGKVIATQAGSNSETYIDSDDVLRKSFAKFKTYRTIGEGFAGLKSGEYDALIIDEIAARYEMNKLPDAFELVNVTVGEPTEFGIGFRRGTDALRDKFQKVFDEMIKDGTAQKISEHWFGTNLIKSAK